MSALHERLKILRAEKGITQRKLANDLKCSCSTIALYETGHRNPDNETLIRIADYFQVTLDYLLGRSDLKKVDESKDECNIDKFVKIPVLGCIRAGEPILSQQNIIDYEYVSKMNLPPGEFFYLKASGDSMNLSNILDGSVVLVSVQDEIKNGDIAVVLIDGEGVTIKRFHRSGNSVTLIPNSSNQVHLPQVIDNRLSSLRVIGKVVQIIISL